MAISQDHKLYNTLREVEIPDCVLRFNDHKRIVHQRIKSLAFVRWPDGHPCVPVNMYLLDNVHKWTGDTSTIYASELSELIRYCARREKGFGDLTDADIFALVEKLRTDTSPQDPHQRVRNDNTVRKIGHRCLDFLFWFQENLHHRSHPLIGERGVAPAIVCERRKNPHARNREYWHHRSLPESESTTPKMPLGLGVIEDIEAVIYRLGDVLAYPEPASRRFKRDPDLFKALVDYLYERRVFMVWMMKRTGLRPEELARMSVRDNQDACKNKVLVLSTMKRRKLDPPLRRFPITANDGLEVLRYLDARTAWIAACRQKQPEYVETDAMFLSTEPGNYGAAIAKTGLEKDFKRLCDLAGYRDKEACFSMFRHRFITNEVLVHLKQWESGNGPATSEADYRAILKRVQEKTGHGDVTSLMPYIAIAREMGGAWSNTDRALDRLYAADHFRMDLERLTRDLRVDGGKMAAEQILDMVITRLERILKDGRAAGLEPTQAKR